MIIGNGVITVKSATVKVVLYTSKVLSNGEHPIMIKITKNRVRKYISLGISSPKKWWDKKKELPTKKHPRRNELNVKISKYESEFNNKIFEFNLSNKEYSIPQLIEEVIEPVVFVGVFDYFEKQIKTLQEENRRKYAKTFNDTKQQLFSFYGSSKLMFADVDYSFLSKWESWMRKKGMKETSMSVFFRTFRTLFNNAIKVGLVSEKSYPFKKFNVSKFNTKTKKRAISKEEMLKIIGYETKEGSKLRDAQNIFIFSYLNQGINFIDIVHLKWKAVSSRNVLEYTRSKTKHEFHIKLDALSLKILGEYRVLYGHSPENYIFPVLNRERHITPIQIENRLHKVMDQVNKNLKIIGKDLGIDKPITTYVARHTYATVLKKSGVALGVISNAMGHESESITKVYLDEFENDVFYEANKNLV